MKTWLLLGLLLAVGVAGCIDEDSPSATPEEEALAPAVRPTMPEDPMPEGPGHDHTDVSQHQFLWNYEFTHRDPLMQNQAQIAGLHALDIQDGHLFGAIYGASTISVNGGIAVWDLSNPDVPQLTGQFRIPGSVGGDRSMEATKSGNYVVLGTEPVTCFGQVNPVPIDVYLFDTTDKTNPLPVDVISRAGNSVGNPAGLGPRLGSHSIAVHEIQGRDFAFIFGDIYEIVPDENLGAHFEATGASINVGHDLYLRTTPWGDVWALTANGGGGLQIFNVTDPFNPVELANWDLPERSSYEQSYYMHTADVGFFDDQIVIILSSEDWMDWPSPMWILDGTPMLDFEEGGEPLLLEWIGTWQNPGGHTALGTSFSLHNPRFQEDGVLTLSSYHGGLWQLDFRHPDFRTLPEGEHPADGGARPAEIAYVIYADGEATMVEDPVHDTIESNLCGLGLTLDAPTYMDVEYLPSGHLYAADVYMGLYAFKPTANHPVYGTTASA
ncbi:MAG: hypothetical protein ACPHID_04580 [Thermoplasmatota archaeon]